MRKKTTAKKSLLSSAQDVSEVETVISALIYGRSGTGKTTLTGTFPNLLVLDIGERGTDSISDVKGAKVIKVKSWQDFEDIYWELKEGDHIFKSVSVDALHSLQSLAIKKIKEDAKKGDNDQTSQRDFGQASGLLNQWILNYRDLIDLGINVIFLAHDKVSEYEGEDDEMITPEVGPRLMPSFASTVVGAVNLIGYTFIKQTVTKSKKLGAKPETSTEYCLRIGPNSLYTTKVRSAKTREVPEYLVDATYDKLVQTISGKTEQRNLRRRRA